MQPPADARQLYAGAHPERVARIAVALAIRLGYGGRELDAIELGALLHDIGKAGIPEALLLKPGPLDEDEWRVMRAHPLISDSILAGIEFHPFVREIARSSHERIDGAGYPDGLAAERIPLPARIVAVADAFDALTTDRAYRTGRSTSFALAELGAHAGSQFCPRVVAALVHIHEDDPRVLAPTRSPWSRNDRRARSAHFRHILRATRALFPATLERGGRLAAAPGNMSEADMAGGGGWTPRLLRPAHGDGCGSRG